MLVTLPEETPVNEMVETAYKLEDKVGVHLTPIVVNGMYPEMDLDIDPAEAAARAGVRLTEGEVESLRRAAAFRMHRQGLQAQQARRLAEALPLVQLHLPFLFTTELGAQEVDELASALAEQLAPLPDPDLGDTEPTGSEGADDVAEVANDAADDVADDAADDVADDDSGPVPNGCGSPVAPSAVPAAPSTSERRRPPAAGAEKGLP
jgi:hypothetical protein